MAIDAGGKWLVRRDFTGEVQPLIGHFEDDVFFGETGKIEAQGPSFRSFGDGFVVAGLEVRDASSEETAAFALAEVELVSIHDGGWIAGIVRGGDSL